MPRLTPDKAAAVAAVETDLRRVLGNSAREIRLQAGAHLEDVSRAAKRNGLPWTIGRVGDLESGRVELKLETLLSLALVYGEVLGKPVALADLLAHDGPVMINGREIDSLTGAVSGAPVQISAGQREHDELNRADTLPAPALADRRAAKSLGIEADVLMRAAQQLWGHPLSVERDRVAGAGANVSERGSVTRSLQAQIRELLDSATTLEIAEEK